MISTAILTIGRILVMGLGSIQPAVVAPTAPVVPSIVIAARTINPAASSAVRGFSSDIFSRQQTNAERAAEGLSELQPDALLTEVARQHSEDMAQRNYFDHIAPGPGPVSPMDRYLAALGTRPDYAFLGENIYFRSATDSSDMSSVEATSAFMHSPEHRANIMQPRFTKVGIGFYRDPSTGAFWVTEMFLRDQN